MTHEYYMNEAIKLSMKAVIKDLGGPFGAVIVKDGKIISKGHNKVTSNNDPTAHAEITAIRNACKTLNTFKLTGCIIYTSCEPCPMCLSAIYWSRIEKIYYANTRTDAAKIGFDDDFIYEELKLDNKVRKLQMEQIMRKEALDAFQSWSIKIDKIEY
ncbi:MAG: nucleoside deaminase [Spirochaetota bacterium]|nr:nucleoside deaminase [Spirochaetota bacterium]